MSSRMEGPEGPKAMGQVQRVLPRRPRGDRQNRTTPWMLSQQRHFGVLQVL